MDDLKNERMKLRALENLFAEKRFSDAYTFAQKLTVDYPNSYHIGFIYVKILKELNRLKEAEAAALKLIPLSPNNINLLSELGLIYLKQNKYAESSDFFNKVLFLDPFNSEARESLDKIKDSKMEEPDGGIEFVESIEPVEPVEPIEPVEPVEPEPVESVESLEPVKLSETAKHPSLIPKKPAVPTEKFEDAPEMEEMQAIEELGEIDETQEVPEMGEMQEMAGIAEIEGIAEIPGGVDVAGEVDSMDTQPIDPYADFYNEERINSEEENIPLEEAVPETTRVMALHEPGDAAEFVTESAANLYLSQGLYEDALKIYEKLYVSRREGRFLLKVKQLKAHRMGIEKIRRLNEFLRLIQIRGV